MDERSTKKSAAVKLAFLDLFFALVDIFSFIFFSSPFLLEGGVIFVIKKTSRIIPFNQNSITHDTTEKKNVSHLEESKYIDHTTILRMSLKLLEKSSHKDNFMLKTPFPSHLKR